MKYQCINLEKLLTRKGELEEQLAQLDRKIIYSALKKEITEEQIEQKTEIEIRINEIEYLMEVLK